MAVAVAVDGAADTGESQRHVRRQATEESKQKKTIALALNGGSFTAGNGCAGIMRGFQQQRVTIDGEQRPAMEAFEYVSGLSGGNLAIFPYHYAQYTTSDEILDAHGNSDPSKITVEDLEVIPEKSLFKPFVVDVTISLIPAVFYALFLGGKDIWSVVMSFHMLQHKGIATGTKMTDVKIREDVKSKPISMTSMLGPAETFPNYEFYTMSRGMMTELRDEHENRLQRVEIPAFPGFPDLQFHEMDNDYLLELAEKYNYQFPFPGFLTHEGLEVPFTKEVNMKFDNVVNMTADDVRFTTIDSPFSELSSESNPFTVEKALGLATDVLVLMSQLRGIDIFGMLPDQIANPIHVDIPTADGGKRKMVFSDGGYSEGTGIPPLVKKKIDKIISIWNPTGVFANPILVGGAYGPFFGMSDFNQITSNLNSFMLANGPFNHMFDLYDSNGENQILKLIETMESLQAAGEPMIATLKDVAVIDNPFYGIEGGWTTDLTVILGVGVPGSPPLKDVAVIDNPFYGIEGGWTTDLTVILGVGVPDKFAAEIPEGIVTPPAGRNVTENGYFTNEEFASVPNVESAPMGPINVTLPHPFEAVEFPFYSVGNHLPVKEARMTQIMNSWIIGRAWDGLKGADGEVKFEGFKKLFEEDDGDDGEEGW
eukprot:CAMPEP_0197466288 /NCGR_PEP_ID=MMETSP1175-20131217/64973_1 /TAXON_ID=1003142 /ORGANISM="Triceratium dubium, Strain CCMP147" /LENGTH=651 /DNA_ID=CAMNT_0043002321 /DNA_START=170 /DNA_END=2121 /DNA_ORIENTATION=+